MVFMYFPGLVKSRKFFHSLKLCSKAWSVQCSGWLMRTKRRSSQSHMFFKIGVLKNFTNFAGMHLCWSLFLIKLHPWASQMKNFSYILLVQAPEIRNSQIYENCQTLIITLKLFKFLSSFCTYLWDTHNLKYISKVHVSNYFCRVVKKMSLPNGSVFF